MPKATEAYLDQCKTVRRGQAMGEIDPALDPEAGGEVVLSSYFGLYLQKVFHPNLDVRKYKTAVLSLFNGNFKVDT